MRIPFLVASLVLITATLPAQLPRGTAVYSKLLNPGVPGVLGGLVTFHPVHGNFQGVTGLPGLLTGAAYPTLPANGVGANCVLVRDSDGALFVGPIVRNGNPLHIYQIALTGNVATVTATFPIGVPSAGLLIDQMAWLPSGDLLFSHRGAMAGFPQQGIAILNLTSAPGAVTIVPFAPLPANLVVNAIAVDALGTTAFVGMFDSTATLSHIFSVPLPGGGVPAPRLVSPLVGTISQLQFDGAGRLLAGLQGGGGTSGLVAIDLTLGTPLQLTPSPGLNGMAVDTVSGAVLLANTSAVAGTSTMSRFAGGLLFAVPAKAGNDSPSGVAIRASMAAIGTVPPNTPQSTRWQLNPNPGGAPVIPLAGVNPFSLSLDVAPNTALGLVVFSLGRVSSSTVPGPLTVTNVLVDPAMLIGPATLLLPSGVPATFTIPLSIPAGLRPMPVFAQALHLDPLLPLLAGGAALELRIH